ncbi:hypothetical protein GQ457_12G010130 [Hibiscus cannabinus]
MGDSLVALKVWDLGVPPKIQCLMWFVLLDRFPKLFMLQARGWLEVYGISFLHGGEFQWWLVGCAEVFWSLWLARNKVIFQGKEWELVDLCFLVKLRSFYWVKADALNCFLEESQWWCCPLDCIFPVAAKAVWRGVEWCPPFAGSGWGKPSMAGCGGVLRYGEGRIHAIFSGSLGILASNVAELRTIVFALEANSLTDALAKGGVERSDLLYLHYEG